jgi:nicotinate dehydrogenase subunit B
VISSVRPVSLRHPRRDATIATVDDAALRRAAKGPIEIVRDGNFLAILGGDETVVEAVAAVAPNHVVWDGVDAIQPFQEEARWLLQQPSIDRTVGPLPHPILQRRAAANRRPIPGCISPTHRSRRPVGSPSIATGGFTVWTYSQGVYPLRDALRAP